MPNSNLNLSLKIRSGAIISFLARYCDLIVQLFVSAILSRLLSPAEFGVVAVVTVFVVFFQIFSEAGIGPAVIQEEKLVQEDIATLFNLTVILGILISGAFFFSAGLIASFYSNQVYVRVVRYISLTLLFSTLSIVPQALLRKKQRFALHGSLTIASSLLSGLVAVIFAFQGASFYALVYRSILSSFLQFVLCAFAVGLRFQFVFSNSTIRRIASFSLFQLLFNFINYFSRNLDKLLLGRYLGVTSLGYYEKSYRLMMLPLQTFTFALSPVLHPILAEYRKTPEEIYKAYLHISRLMALIGFPLSIFLVFSAKELILIVFGPQWMESVRVFEILAFSVGLQMILSLTGSIFQAAGRTDLLFFSGLLSAFLMIFGTVLGIAAHSLTVLAWALLSAFTANFFQGHYLLIRLALKSKLIPFYRQLLTPFLIAFFLYFALFSIEALFPEITNSRFFSLFIKSFISFICFIIISKISGDWDYFKSLWVER